MKAQIVPFARRIAFASACGVAWVLTCGERVRPRRGWSRWSRSSGIYAEHESGRPRLRTTVDGCHGPWLTSLEKIDLHACQVTMTRPRHNRAADPERGRRDGPKTVRNTPGGYGVAIWQWTDGARGRRARAFKSPPQGRG